MRGVGGLEGGIVSVVVGDALRGEVAGERAR